MYKTSYNTCPKVKLDGLLALSTPSINSSDQSDSSYYKFYEVGEKLEFNDQDAPGNGKDSEPSSLDEEVGFSLMPDIEMSRGFIDRTPSIPAYDESSFIKGKLPLIP